jgi:hypothetical protein
VDGGTGTGTLAINNALYNMLLELLPALLRGFDFFRSEALVKYQVELLLGCRLYLHYRAIQNPCHNPAVKRYPCIKELRDNPQMIYFR